LKPRKPLALYIFAPPPVVDHVMASTSSGAVLVGDTMVHKGNPGLPFGGWSRGYYAMVYFLDTKKFMSGHFYLISRYTIHVWYIRCI